MGYSGRRERTEEEIFELAEKNKELIRKITIADNVDALKLHPNYKDLEPIKGESIVAYTLRYAANLVSPPQFEGESYDIECVTIKAGILGLEKEIEEKWNKFNKID